MSQQACLFTAPPCPLYPDLPPLWAAPAIAGPGPCRLATVVLAVVLASAVVVAVAVIVVLRQRRDLTEARHLALHDDTTGLPNRRAVLAELAAAQRRGDRFGVVLLDVDRFKTINDTFGHEAGNDLLTEIGRRLAALGPTVWAGRLAGDEFVLIVTGDADTVAAAARAAWRTVADPPVYLAGHQLPIAASAGHTTGRLGLTPRDLLREADFAMYEAKRTGLGVHGPQPASGPPPDRRRHRH